MKNTARCEDLTGVFLLYESGVLVGLGITPFGSFTSKDRTWFEDPPASVVKVGEIKLFIKVLRPY